MEELKAKHASGTNEKDDVDRAPTGAAYKALHYHQQQQSKAIAMANEQRNARTKSEENEYISNVKEQMRRMKFDSTTNDNDEYEKENADNYDNDNNSSEDEDEDEYDHLLNDDDDELAALRAARIAQLKAEQVQRAQHQALGHGSLRTITQDEFLPECTGSSKYVCVHFFHDEKVKKASKFFDKIEKR